MAEFYEALLEHLPVYVAVLAAAGSLLYALFRKRVVSLLDPLLYYLVVTEAFCVADVVFMYLYDVIETRYAVSYLASEAALLAGVLLFRPAAPPALPDTERESGADGLRLAFRISVGLFVALNLLVYSQKGIPLLAESRFEAYTSGGGWGLLTRLFDVLLVIIVYRLMEVYRRGEWKAGHWAVLALVLAIQILTGAKSAVLILAFIVALYDLFAGARARPHEEARGLPRKRLAVAAIAGFLLIASVQSSELEILGVRLSVLDQAALRLVNNGDALIYAYPGGFVEELDGSHPVAALFKEYLAFFRLAVPEQLPTHLGVQISTAFFGADAVTQTNAKHNLFGYVYFGALGSVLFSFAVGACVGFARYALLRVFPRRWPWGVAYVVLNVYVVAAGSEWDIASRAVLNVMALGVVALGVRGLEWALWRRQAAQASLPS